MNDNAGTETDAALEERIAAIVVREGMVDREKLVPDATLEDLGVDSVEVVMILNGIEEEFGIYVPIDETMSEVRTVGDLLGVITTLVQKKAAGQGTE
ncbi:MAG TPA: phosphopantetheine-binding protein [Kaistiaceae bacterium]|nr:phosphopantetheine-binding protein [Kaistiaceae bacterium]